ncbi:TPR end-of-group domain-containing protein [Pontibacter toksunensis]|uniref:TPR end-of-group domain-containing protein n=1 Tax=Pontibacter toksunensis TaxID=1332631 RepID=A0ABW6BW19_9BACT
MKKTLLTALLVVSMTAAVSAQSIGEASAMYNTKDYKASGEMYDKALAQGKGTSTDYYNAACSWALAGDKKKALAHLQQAVAKGLQT